VTDEAAGITPPAGPGGRAAYALASMSGPGRNPNYPPDPRRRPDPGYPQDQGHQPGPSYPSRRGRPAESGRPAPRGPAAYPEGPVHHQHQPPPGGPAAPPRPTRARRAGGVRGAQVPYVIVLAGLAAGLAYIWQGPHSVRAGTFILAGAFFVAVAARLALPQRRAGMLASRRRYIDVTALAILAIGLLVAGLVLPTPS
jgi:Protein of unknown function (DUF3017)